MNSKYEQGWQQAREILKRKSAQRRHRRLAGKVLGIILLAIIAGMVLSALAGCATSAPVAVKDPLTEVGQPATLTGLVQVAQMGEDCTSQDRALRRILREVMTSQGAPAPQKVAFKALAGSSLCGFAQGTANEAGTLELGARNLARAKVSLYWSDITYSQLQKAQAVLSAMRPLRPPSKTAHHPIK